MKELLSNFLSLQTIDTPATLKQKVFVFAANHKKDRNHLTQMNRSKSKCDNPQSATSQLWKPKIPSKKLFEDPKFFISLERKKVRILDGLKTISQFGEKHQSSHQLKGSKSKQKSMKHKRGESLPVCQKVSKTVRNWWQPNFKTPYINFNLQHLIRRRKAGTPVHNTQSLRRHI